MKKHYRITSNGFICLFHNGIKTSTHFYSKGDELELEAFGYERVWSMSVSFIYQNMTFYYRIDSHSSSMPFIAWGCRQLPISGNSPSKEAMYSDIEKTLRQYYRNRKPKADAESVANNRSLPVCDTCGLTSPKMEGLSTCPDCLIDNE